MKRPIPWCSGLEILLVHTILQMLTTVRRWKATSLPLHMLYDTLQPFYQTQ